MREFKEPHRKNAYIVLLKKKSEIHLNTFQGGRTLLKKC